MTNHATAVLATEPVLPMDIVGWVVLALSVGVTLAWLRYVYR